MKIPGHPIARVAAALLAALLAGGCVLAARADRTARGIFEVPRGEPVAVPYEWARPAGGPPAWEAVP